VGQGRLGIKNRLGAVAHRHEASHPDAQPPMKMVNQGEKHAYQRKTLEWAH
jgi:hypothetical protein